MTALTPTSPHSCRAMAAECGRQANEYVAARQYAKAGKEIERARRLTLLALELENSSDRTSSPDLPDAPEASAGASGNLSQVAS